MKKNLVPLLGIAFVVAIATTGIFYGLFVNRLGASTPAQVVVAAKTLKAGTTLTAEHLKAVSWNGSAPAGSFTSPEQVVGRTVARAVSEGEPVSTAAFGANGASGGVAPHMRAVSTHVTDSVGVLEMLQVGDHVDVQVIATRDHGDAEIRTILQNKAVLAVHSAAEPTSHGAAAVPVVTLLVDKNEAEALALADSTSRVRLVLRNPSDQDRLGQAGLSLGVLMRQGAPKESAPIESASVAAPVEPVAAKTQPNPPAARPEVQLQVQVLGAAPAAFEELFRQADATGRPDVFQASAVRRPVELASAIRNLQSKRSLDLISTSEVKTAWSSSVSLEAGRQDPQAGVRIRFSPVPAANGRLRLNVEPVVTTPGAVRKLDTTIEVAAGQPFLLGGLVQAKERTAILDKFFGGKELVVVVTPINPQAKSN